MKKYVITASILVLLAGCSASASMATPKNTVAEPTQTTKQVTFTKMIKPQRNTIQMNKTIKYLKTRVGRTSYVFSGSSPRGWDCSGLVRWTYERFGLELPHSADAQGHIGRRVSQPKVGDIVVFAHKGSTNFYHAAIYIGNGKIINAYCTLDTCNSKHSAGVTRIQPLSDYKDSQIRFIRVVDTL